MRGSSVPNWLLSASVILFVASWLLAPAETLSGQVAPPSHTPPSRLLAAFDVARLSVKPPPSDERPARMHGFGRPYELALTFDDGPHPLHTTRLMEILARHQVKAAFFVNGVWLARGAWRAGDSRAVLMRSHAEGHLIGNHTYSHKLLSRLKPEQQTWQIVANELLLDEIVGERPKVFRPPYGQMTKHATEVLARYGYQEVMWNITARESDAEEDPVQIAKMVWHWIRHHKGGILLLHDRHPWSVDATEIILATLLHRNCRRLRKRLPLYRVVPLDYFLRSPAESQALAGQIAAERKRHRTLTAKLCVSEPRGRLDVNAHKPL
jgi:peptidoglycan/xylan/chitin deacetylase (PgdA/CDA1 family)